MDELTNDVTTVLERGWPGHHRLSRFCLFNRNTLIECGERRVIVSSVGEHLVGFNNPPKELPDGGFFETKAFEADWHGTSWECDTERPIQLPNDRDWRVHDWQQHAEVNQMHEDAVRLIILKLEGER